MGLLECFTRWQPTTSLVTNQETVTEILVSQYFLPPSDSRHMSLFYLCMAVIGFQTLVSGQVLPLTSPFRGELSSHLILIGREKLVGQMYSVWSFH